MSCYVCLTVGQWNQGGGGAAPGGEQTSTQVTIPKDVSNVIGHGRISVELVLDCLFPNCLYFCVPELIRFGGTGATWTVNGNTEYMY